MSDKSEPLRDKRLMQHVRRRLVFYVGGFDPRGASYYHGLYSREAAKQAAVNGMRIETGPRKRAGRLVSHWKVHAHDAGGEVEADYCYLHWDDIVRARWTKNPLIVSAQALSAFWFMVRTGALKRFYRLSWPFALTAAYPFLQMVVTLLAALIAGLVVYAGAAWLGQSPVWANALVAIALGLGAGAFVLERAARANVFWIGRVTTVMSAFMREAIPEVEERAAALAGEIIARRKTAETGPGCDEVVIVGHSVGADIATRIIARILELDPDFASGSVPVSYLTLGQLVIFEAMPEGSPGFRQDLAKVACAHGLTWIDFAAPADPACIALVDPLKGSLIDRPAGAEIRPKLLSPRFPKLFAPEAYQKLRKEKMTMHFMYLQATDIAGDYDYFAITAGSRTLAARYEHLDSNSKFDLLQGGILGGKT